MRKRLAAGLFLLGAAALVAACGTSPPPAPPQPPPAATTPVADEPFEVAVDLRPFMTPVKDQGDRDACAFFSLVAHLEATLKRELGRDVDLSEEFAIHATKAAGVDADRETANVATVFMTLRQRGLLLEQDWSYQPTWFARGFPECGFDYTDKSAPSKCYAHNAPPAAVLARSLPTRLTRGAFFSSMRELFAHLAAKKSVIFAFPLPKDHTGWPKSGDLHWDDAIQARHGDSDKHLALLSGYDPATRRFTFKNSWGKGWGHEGYGTISYEVLRAYGGPMYAFELEAARFDAPAPERPKATALGATATTVPAKGVVVSVTGEVTHVAGRFVMVQTELVRQPRDSTAADFADVRDITLTNDERAKFHASTPSAVWNHVSSEQAALRFTPAAPLRLELPKDLWQTPSVASVRASRDERVVVRTTVSVFTDDAGFQPLARTHTPWK
jgi:hypothetical protein